MALVGDMLAYANLTLTALGIVLAGGGMAGIGLVARLS
jgi:hypothetical protein